MEKNTENSACAGICITYEGDAVASHTIDAELFAQNIMAASKILKETSKALYGYEVKLSTEIEKIEPNCISTKLNVVLSRALDCLQFFTNSTTAQILDEILKIAGYSCAVRSSIYWIYRKIKNRKHKNVDSYGDMKKLTMDDDDEIFIDEKIYALLCNRSFDEQILKHTSILEKPGFEKIKYSRRSGDTYVETESITKSERKFFDFRIEDQDFENEEELIVELNRPSYYKESSGWKMVNNFGVMQISFKIEDKEFLKMVSEGKIQVRKGKKFAVRLLEKRKQGWEKSKYEAIKITPIDKDN